MDEWALMLREGQPVLAMILVYGPLWIKMLYNK